jgi:hypothetical protein
MPLWGRRPSGSVSASGWQSVSASGWPLVSVSVLVWRSGSPWASVLASLSRSA